MFSTSTRRWHAEPDKIRGLLFPRSTDMLAFLDKLIRRTRLFFRKEKVLPIICFYGAWPGESPMNGVDDRLRGQSRVIVSRVTAPTGRTAYGNGVDTRGRRGPTLAEIASLRILLDHIVKEFSGDFPHVRRLRFPHYSNIARNDQSILHDGTIVGERKHADDLYARIMCSWGRFWFAQFAFELIQRMDGTYNPGFASTWHGFKT